MSARSLRSCLSHSLRSRPIGLLACLLSALAFIACSGLTPEPRDGGQTFEGPAARGTAATPEVEAAMARHFFSRYEPIASTTLDCPYRMEPLRVRRKRSFDEFCGTVSWPDGVRYRGPVRRYGNDGALWHEGQYEERRPVGIWTVYAPDGSVYAQWDYDAGVLDCPEGSSSTRLPGGDGFMCFLHEERRAGGPWLTLNEAQRISAIGTRGEDGREGTHAGWNLTGELEWVRQFHHNELVWEFTADEARHP